MRCLRCLVIFFCFFVSINALAQSGCLLDDGRLYTTYSGGFITARLYHGSPMYLTSGYCSWSSSSTTSCKVCLGSINIGSLICFGAVEDGEQGNFTMVECPIDDYTWLLLVPTVVIALFKIRSRYR